MLKYSGTLVGKVIPWIGLLIMLEFSNAHAGLSSTLVVENGQEGFVGITGETTTIAPSGSWEIVRFVNERQSKPHRTGQLTTIEIETLADALRRNEFESFPRILGEEVPINRHMITLRYASKESSLVLKPGTRIRDAQKFLELHLPTAGKFVNIIGVVEELLKEPIL